MNRSILLELMSGLVGTLKDLGERNGEAATAIRDDLRATLKRAGEDLHERVKRQIVRHGMTKPAAFTLMLANFVQSEQLNLDSLELLLGALGVDCPPEMPVRGHPLDDLSNWVITEDLHDK